MYSDARLRHKVLLQTEKRNGAQFGFVESSFGKASADLCLSLPNDRKSVYNGQQMHDQHLVEQ